MRRFSWIIISNLISLTRHLRSNELTVHCCHDESDLHGICRACEMGVDLLGLVLVKGDESVQDVIARRGIVGATY